MKPLLTEKSMNLAKTGKYTFVFDKGLIKKEIAKIIGAIYDVHVKSVSTVNYKGGEKRNNRGRDVKIKAFKKAYVTLAEGEELDIYGSSEE